MPERLDEMTFPIGTLEELVEIGADPRKIPSCGPRTRTENGTILGCNRFRECRFRAWKEQQVKADGTKLRGPLNLGVEITLAVVDGGATQQHEMACYHYYANNTKARQKQQDETGELIRVVAYEGDGQMIAERCTRRKAGEPITSPVMETYNNVHEVRPHLRPKDRFPVVAAAHASRQENLDPVEAEALRRALGTSTAVPVEPAADEGPVGKPVKVKA